MAHRSRAPGHIALLFVCLAACGGPSRAADAWHVGSIGLAPIELRTHVPAACGADVTFIGLTDAHRPLRDDVAESALGAMDGSDTPAGLERAIAEDIPRRSSAPGMASSYSGPGGDPLFRWRLGAFYSPTFVFDRRVGVARVVAAMRAADTAGAGTVFIGGVDERGERVCVRIAASDDLFQGAEGGYPVVATASARGDLSVESFVGFDRPPVTVDWASDPIWPGDLSPRQPMHIRRAPEAGAYGWLRGAALARSMDRWPVLVLE